MRKSDIFEDFIRIAQEKGLVSFDETAKKSKKILEENPRTDSQDISTIKALYNVKPDAPKEMQYEYNIMETAHPQSCVISPSHDKLNGLIENENERQNITIRILQKQPDGLLLGHKYAKQQLLLSLVKVGNFLDNNNKEELRILADNCLTKFDKPIKKEAFPVLLTAIPLLLGAIYTHQHLPDINEGFKKNSQDLIGEVDDLLNAEAHWYGTGYNISPQLKQDMQDFKNKLLEFEGLYHQIEPLLADIQKPRDAKELLELAKKPETQDIIKAYHTLKVSAANLFPYLQQIQKNFSSTSYKETNIEGRGWLTWLVDKPEVLHGGAGLVADDFDDVVHAIAPYKKSIEELLQMLKQAESMEDSIKQQLQQVYAEIKEPTVPATVTPVSAPGPEFATTSPAGSEEKDLGKELSQLEQEFGELA